MGGRLQRFSCGPARLYLSKTSVCIGSFKDSLRHALRVVCTYFVPSRDFLGALSCLQANHYLTSRPWRPRASLPHRRPHIESVQPHAVLRVRTMSVLTITTAINERHRRPRQCRSTLDPDLILLFGPSRLLYAPQIPAFLACSLRLLVPPSLPLLNLYRPSSRTLTLVHIPCL